MTVWVSRRQNRSESPALKNSPMAISLLCVSIPTRLRTR